jgi:hypothetical protein
LGVELAQPLFANIEDERDLDTMRNGIRLFPRSADELMEDGAWLERHLARPRWGTCQGSDGAVKLYRFWRDGDLLYVQARGGSRRDVSLRAAMQLPWEPDALATRRAYLQRWLGRQLLVRLASNLVMAALMPGSHVATEYLRFLFEIDQRMVMLAPALARTYGKEAVDRPSALEAIRGSDALLRAWCESARVGVAG